MPLPPGRDVLLDTNIIVYSVEKVIEYWPTLVPLWASAKRHEVRLVASEVVIPELLAKPLRVKNYRLVAQYRAVLQPRSLTLYPITQHILQRAAYLRAEFGLKTPDAIIASTAVEHEALLLTNDKKLAAIDDAETIYLEEAAAS